MISISSPDKFKSRKEWEIHARRTITRELAALSSVKEVEKLLASLLTDHEQRQMVRRAGAADFLRRGKTYREVGEAFWLSPTVISALRKSLVEGDYVGSYATRKKKK